jgi:hypothetical protein
MDDGFGRIPAGAGSRSIRVGTIRPCLRERSPAILLRVSALRVTIACAGFRAAWQRPVRRQEIPLNPP